MNLERAFHLTEGGYQPAWPLVQGCDLVSRAIWDKEEDKANEVAWDLCFPEDSAHLLPPSTTAGGMGSVVGGREAVIHPSPQSVWEPGRDSHELVPGRFPRVQRISCHQLR